ncbi:hypothetical protein B0T16DRAFT_388517 [Cercophora newfieldiana]|uniref:Ankyrin n=1 Tax=Cercophora newfieldiana TaxID=92897 RepID=A0AA40CSZ4_9PEZI|nr:hypothetical protein B0T16DRAFT_388517 [Cercophora newfieldiana]
MNPFDRLPPEIVEQAFECFVLSRDFARAMRLRLVSRLFRDYTDAAIFQLRLLSQFVGDPRGVHKLPPPHGGYRASWRDYVYSYLACQARRERFTRSHVGRVHRAAHALCEGDGDTNEAAIATCVRSLLRLAVGCRPDILLQGPDTLPLTTSECTDGDLQDDIDVAAIYLGRTAHVARLVASKDFALLGWPGKRVLRSSVFGEAIMAAADGARGNLEIIKLLLSHMPERYPSSSVKPVDCALGIILYRAARCGDQALFDFALDSMSHPSLSILDGALITPWPKNFERAAGLIAMRSKSRAPNPSAWLACSAAVGNVELVRYFLDRVRCPLSRPLLKAIEGRSDVVVQMLLDAGAQPIITCTSPRAGGGRPSLLRIAAWKCSVAIAKMLLDRGADPNEGTPPPIVVAVYKEHLAMFRLLQEYGARLDTPETGGCAMAVAKQHGLHSMVQVLIREGVSEDISGVKTRVWGRDELYRGLECKSTSRAQTNQDGNG